ncbi:MAG: amidohydrolase [Leptolyngbya sp. PLA3]|nr:MAG: amidohydrolase [Cyanobacteria bacterium CYA]MCE7967202.1 amidohydrolase [Leptolyngbya sp. PL-A3]
MTRPAATIIDAHQHFWRPSRGDYGWLTPQMSTLYRNFEPGDLKPMLDACGVRATVLVQAAPTVDETRYLLSLSEAHPWIRGVVGWVDFDHPAAGVAQLAELASHPMLVGVRPMVQDIPDVEWLRRPSHAPVWDAIVERGLMFDALVKPAHLESLAGLLEDRPELPCVLDHAGKPTVALGKDSGFWVWGNWMQHIARESSVWCKVSGLVTEAGPGWSVDRLRPFVDVLIQAFGPRRLIWGSDWPMLNLAGDYTRWFQATEVLLGGLSGDDRAAVLGGNAVRAYQLDGVPA